jgi:hypothetical protein
MAEVDGAQVNPVGDDRTRRVQHAVAAKQSNCGPGGEEPWVGKRKWAPGSSNPHPAKQGVRGHFAGPRDDCHATPPIEKPVDQGLELALHAADPADIIGHDRHGPRSDPVRVWSKEFCIRRSYCHTTYASNVGIIGAESARVKRRSDLARDRWREAPQHGALSAKQRDCGSSHSGYVAISHDEPIQGAAPEQVRELREQTTYEVVGGISHRTRPEPGPRVGVEPWRDLVVNQRGRVVDETPTSPARRQRHADLEVNLGSLSPKPPRKRQRLAPEGYPDGLEHHYVARRTRGEMMVTDELPPTGDFSDLQSDTCRRMLTGDQVAASDAPDPGVIEVPSELLQPLGAWDGVVVDEGDDVATRDGRARLHRGHHTWLRDQHVADRRAWRFLQRAPGPLITRSAHDDGLRGRQGLPGQARETAPKLIGPPVRGHDHADR